MRTSFSNSRPRPLLLRGPAPPFLLATDLIAFWLARGTLAEPSWPDLVAVAVLVGCLRIQGMHKSRLSLSVLDELPFLVGSVVVCVLVAHCVAYLAADQTTAFAASSATK